MATLERQKYNVSTVLPNSVKIHFQYPRELNGRIETRLGNSFKDSLMDSLDGLSKVACENKADLVYEASKRSIEFVGSYDKSSFKDDFGNIISASLNPVAAVLGHKRIAKMDTKAKQVIDVIDVVDEKTSDDETVKVEIDIESIGNNEHPDVTVPYTDFLDHFRKPFTEPRIRNKIVKAYSDKTEINKILLRTLENLFKHEWDKHTFGFIGNEVIELTNLKEFTKTDFEKAYSKWICVEYMPQKKVNILKWVNDTVDFAIRNRIMSPHIAIMAKYAKFKDYEVPALVGEFNRAGASFMNFPKGSKNFKEALVVLEKSLAKD